MQGVPDKASHSSLQGWAPAPDLRWPWAYAVRPPEIEVRKVHWGPRQMFANYYVLFKNFKVSWISWSKIKVQVKVYLELAVYQGYLIRILKHAFKLYFLFTKSILFEKESLVKWTGWDAFQNVSCFSNNYRALRDIIMPDSDNSETACLKRFDFIYVFIIFSLITFSPMGFRGMLFKQYLLPPWKSWCVF